MSPNIIGYASSVILVFTIGSQLVKQWRSGTSKGVSPILFVGQLVASTGFVVYSALVKNAIFTVTNACLAFAALLGIAMLAYHRRKDAHRKDPAHADSSSASTSDAEATRTPWPTKANTTSTPAQLARFG